MRKMVCLTIVMALATIENILLLYRFEHHRLDACKP